eukprot:7358054-Lingulodinium_polyedra.AAC.1
MRNLRHRFGCNGLFCQIRDVVVNAVQHHGHAWKRSLYGSGHNWGANAERGPNRSKRNRWGGP